MKKLNKLTFGTNKLVEVREATCNYCGETKTCFKTVTPAQILTIKDDFRYQEVGENPYYEVPLFGKGYYCCDNYDWKWTAEHLKHEYKEQHTDICEDCVKEIYKFIKS